MATNQHRRNGLWRPLSIALPLFHLCAWTAIALSDSARGTELLVCVDFPLSAILFLVFGWSSHYLLLWFGMFGTLWWYFVVRFAEIEWNRLIGFWRRRHPERH
jgi:hypothetical protein